MVLTDGSKGAYSYSDEGYFYISQYPGPKIEATGAGDAFTTAYVAALAYGKTHLEALNGDQSMREVLSNRLARKLAC